MTLQKTISEMVGREVSVEEARRIADEQFGRLYTYLKEHRADIEGKPLVTAKATHIGEDYATITLAVDGEPGDSLEEIEVGRSVGDWLEKHGAYDK